MLSVPQLDDLSYEKLFERARSRIPAMTQEWTDFNAHDPGITTLQTFAWLTDMLNYYLDASGNAHRMKYYKLLGIEPQIQPARCRISLESDAQEYRIPRGARMTAGSVVFETEKTCSGSVNRTLAVLRESSGRVMDITHLAGEDGSFAEIFSGSEPKLYLGFEKQPEQDFSFYVQIKENPKRNPFEDGFSLVELAWEVYDGKSWSAVKTVQDETCGFLRSGMISLHLDTEAQIMETPLFEAGYYLRCSLIKYHYEQLPELGRISACCIPAVQAETKAQALEYTYSGENELYIDYCIRPDDLITVAVEGETGCLTWFEHSRDENSLCDVVQGDYPWQKVIRFDREKFGTVPQKGCRILVMIAPAELYGQLVIGVGSGCAQEEFDFIEDDLWQLRIAAVTKVGTRCCYQLWEQCDELEKAPCDARVFSFDAKRGRIRFGDGIHGLQTPAGATLMAVTVRISAFENGNVREGTVRTLQDEPEFPVRIENISKASGGCRTGMKELEEQLEKKFTGVTRAVTAEDYRTVIQNTPGLMIDYVNVFTAQEYADCCGEKPKHNTVYAAVKPGGRQPYTELDAHTEGIIRKELENYRLLTTGVQLISPEYVSISVGGVIRLRDDNEAARQAVCDKLKRMIDFSCTGGFGKSVIYGKVFSGIEMMDEVAGIEQLSFECEGRGGAKNERGDILIFPYGLAVIRTMDLDFV